MASEGRSRFIPFFGKDGLAGGLNTSDNPLILSPAQMTVAENIAITQTLARRKRPGQESWDVGSYAGTASYPTVGASHPIRQIRQYHRNLSATGEQVEDLFLHQDAKVWSIESRNSPGVDRTGAAILASSGIPRYQVFQGVLFFLSTETADGYNKWNGLVTTPGDIEAATAPVDGAGKYLGTFRGRMIMAGNPDFPFRVYVSAAFDAEDWISADTTSFDLDYDGEIQGVTAIFPEYQGLLYIATRRSIYELSCTDAGDITTYAVRRITTGIGCASQNTVVGTPNDVLWMSDRGVHSLAKILTSDQVAVSFLSRDIQRTFTDQLNAELFEQAQAVWDEVTNLYVLTVASSGQTLNDVVLCYNIDFGYWTSWIDLNARSLATVLLDNKQYVLLGKENGKINLLNPNLKTDEGTGFTATFKTGKIFTNGEIMRQHYFKSVTILASSTSVSNVTVSWSIDGVDQTLTGGAAFPLGTSASQLGSTFVLGASRLGIGRFLPKRVTIDATGYNMQLQVTAGGDSDIEFYGFILEVDDADPQYT